MDNIEQPGGKAPVPKVATFILVFLGLSILPLIVLVLLRPPSRSTPQEVIDAIQIPQQHTTGQEIVVSANKVTLFVPEGATDLRGNFVIDPRLADLFSFAGEAEWSRPIVVDIEYRNEEGVNYPGITFSQPVSICFNMTSEQWKSFCNSSLTIFRFNISTKSRFRLDGYLFPGRWTPRSSELCGQTDHFSIYALAIKSADLIPITGATITPTSTPIPTATIFNTRKAAATATRTRSLLPLFRPLPTPSCHRQPNLRLNQRFALRLPRNSQQFCLHPRRQSHHLHDPPPTEPPPTEPPPTEPPPPTIELPIETLLPNPPTKKPQPTKPNPSATPIG